jgi:hypothetical protein
MSDHLIAEAPAFASHSEHNKRTALLSAGFEPTIPAMKGLNSYALDREATGIGMLRHPGA